LMRLWKIAWAEACNVIVAGAFYWLRLAKIGHTNTCLIW
jgi:hypothetical protein